jgi:hypothetical protein
MSDDVAINGTRSTVIPGAARLVLAPPTSAARDRNDTDYKDSANAPQGLTTLHNALHFSQD